MELLKKVKLDGKWYEVLKWVCLIVVPAFTLLLTQLGEIWGFDPIKVTKTISAVALFVGTIIGVSTANYRRDLNDGTEDGDDTK